MQDTALMNKLSLAVVRRFLRFLDQQSKKDAAKYLKFYKNYSYYLKAGLIEDRDQGGGRHKVLASDGYRIKLDPLFSYSLMINTASPSPLMFYKKP